MKKDKLRIAVTGADSFIGKKLCEVLENRGDKVFRYTLKDFDIRKKFEIKDRIDILYHLAALNSPYLSKINPIKTFEVNVLGTMNLLEAVRNSGVKKIIFTSSILIYKNLEKTKETDFTGYNLYPYGLEKLIGEEYIKIYSELYKIDYAILRISGVYGSGMCKNPIFDVINGFLKNNVKLYINKNSSYNFIHVDDVVNALVKSLDWKKTTLNVCSDKSIKIKDICIFFKKELKKNVNIEDTEFLVKIIGNNKKIKQKGWKEKYNLKKGLLETYKYFLKQNNYEK